MELQKFLEGLLVSPNSALAQDSGYVIPEIYFEKLFNRVQEIVDNACEKQREECAIEIQAAIDYNIEMGLDIKHIDFWRLIKTAKQPKIENL
jgi:hypothetical protein